ncbi:MAG: hypothetical protein ACFFDS_07700 [Candidatus Thorarchaeota archaeon]
MEKKEKLRFCFYCGAQLAGYNEGQINYCLYCGTKLNYKTKYQIEKPSNEVQTN